MEDVGFGLEKRSWKSKEVAIRCVCVRVRVCVGGGVFLRWFSMLLHTTAPGRSWYCSSQAGVLGTVPARQVGGEVGT